MDAFKPELPDDVMAIFTADTLILAEELVKVADAIIRSRDITYESSPDKRTHFVSPPWEDEVEGFVESYPVFKERDDWYTAAYPRFCRYQHLVAAVEGVTNSSAGIQVGDWSDLQSTALLVGYQLARRWRIMGFKEVGWDASRRISELRIRVDRETALCRIKAAPLVDAFRKCAWVVPPLDVETPIVKCAWLAAHLGMSEPTLRKYREGKGVKRARGRMRGGSDGLNVNECLAFMPDIANDENLQDHQRQKAADFIRQRCGQAYP